MENKKNTADLVNFFIWKETEQGKIEYEKWETKNKKEINDNAWNGSFTFPIIRDGKIIE